MVCAEDRIEHLEGVGSPGRGKPDLNDTANEDANEDANNEMWRLPLTLEHDHQVLLHLIKKLVQMEKSVAAAWRRIIDPEGSMRVTRQHFMKGCKLLYLNADMSAMWNELSSKSGKPWVQLSDLDFLSVTLLVKFGTTLMRLYGDMRSAMAVLGLCHGKRMREDEFVEKMQLGNLVSPSEAKQLFLMLIDGGHQAELAVSPSEFVWLDKLVFFSEVPREDRDSPGGIPHWSSRAPEQAESIAVTKLIARKIRRADSLPRHIKLYKEALERKSLLNKSLECMPSRSFISPDRAEANLQHLSWLHDEAAETLRRRDCAREQEYERLRRLRSPSPNAESNPKRLLYLSSPKKTKFRQEEPLRTVQTVDRATQARFNERLLREGETWKKSKEEALRAVESQEIRDCLAFQSTLHDAKKFTKKVFLRNYEVAAARRKRREEWANQARERREQEELESMKRPEASNSVNARIAFYRLYYGHIARQKMKKEAAISRGR